MPIPVDSYCDFPQGEVVSDPVDTPSSSGVVHGNSKEYHCMLSLTDISKNVNKFYLSSTHKKPLWSKTIEFLFNNALGRKIDLNFKKITLKKWKSKFKHLKQNDTDINFMIFIKVSKNPKKSFIRKKIILHLKHDTKRETHNEH